MNTNEETRLRNLLLKKADGKQLRSLDVLYLEKLTSKKAAETFKRGHEKLRPSATAEREQRRAETMNLG